MAADIVPAGKSAVDVTKQAYAEQPPQQAPHNYASDKSYRFTIVSVVREPIRKVVDETDVIIIISAMGPQC